MSFHLFLIRYSIDKGFYKVNKRHMYIMGNYIMIINDVKTYLTQCFLHSYQDNKYKFFIVNIV